MRSGMRCNTTATNKVSMNPGRNDPGPCGSGKKYKRCCAAQPVVALAAEIVNPREIGALLALVNEERLSEAEHRVRALLAMHPNAGMLWKVLSVALLRQGKEALQAL